MVLLVATTLVPVIVGSGFFFPYVVPRNLYFRALVEIGAAVLIVALCFGRRRLDLRGEPILWALVAFLVAATLSAMLSPARMHSFFGDFERMGGVWAWFNLILYFMLLRTLRDSDWPWVINVALAVGLFVSVRAFAQHGDALPPAGSSVGPSISTIGNSGLLAAYLLVNVGLAAYFAVSNARYRWLYLLAAAIDVVGVIYAGNRSSVIGIILGAVVGGVIFATLSARTRAKWIPSGVATVIALVVVVSSLIIRASPDDGAASRVPLVFRRIALTNPAGADESRTMQWRSAIAAFRDRPLLGYGPENHNLVWGQHFDPKIYRLETDIYDRTHNQFLEVIATTGIVGTAAFLVIWVAIGMTLVRAFRAGRISAAAAGVLWGFQIAYATYLAFWFVDLNSTMLWILIAALIASRATVGPLILEATSTDPSPAHARPSLAFATVVALFAALYAEGYTPFVADRALARIDSSGRDITAAIPDLELLAHSSAHQTAHTPMVMAQYIASLRPQLAAIRGNPSQRQMLDLGFTDTFAAFAREIHRDTLNDRLYTHEAGLLMEAARLYKSAEYRQQAIDAFHKAIDLSPHRIEQRLGLASVYIGERDYERALVILTEAVKTDPQVGEPRYQLAQAYMGAGKGDSALAMLQSSLRLGYVGTPETYLAMGKRLEFSGRSGTAAALYSDYLETKYSEAIWDRTGAIDRPIPAMDIAVAAHLPLVYMRARESELAVKSAAALSAFDPSRTALVDRFVSDVGGRRRGNWVAKVSLLPCTSVRTRRSRDSTSLACGVFRRKL